MLVGDVVRDAGLPPRLSPGAARLEVELLTARLQGGQSLLGPAGQVHVHGGSHARPEVGGAGVEVAVLGVQHEVLPQEKSLSIISRALGKTHLAGLSLHGVLDRLDATGKSLKDSLYVSALLHGDDPQLVLLVDPDQEGFLLVVEDSSPLGPVPLHAGGLEVLVPGHEEEVIVHQLLSDGLLLQGEQELVRSETEVSGGLTMPVRG